MSALNELRKKKIITDLEYTILMADNEFSYHAKRYGFEYKAETCEKAAAELAAKDAVIEAARAYLAHAFTSDRNKLIDTLREYDTKGGDQ